MSRSVGREVGDPTAGASTRPRRSADQSGLNAPRMSFTSNSVYRRPMSNSSASRCSTMICLARCDGISLSTLPEKNRPSTARSSSLMPKPITGSIGISMSAAFCAAARMAAWSIEYVPASSTVTRPAARRSPRAVSTVLRARPVAPISSSDVWPRTASAPATASRSRSSSTVAIRDVPTATVNQLGSEPAVPDLSHSTHACCDNPVPAHR